MKNIYNTKDFEEWFKKLKTVRRKYKIFDWDIYNINKIDS